MVRKIITAGLLALGMSSAAQAYCADHDALKARLEAYPISARVEGLGVTNDKLGLVELYVAPDGRFAVVMTDTSKLSCTLAIGHEWVGKEEEDDTLKKSSMPPLGENNYGEKE